MLNRPRNMTEFHVMWRQSGFAHTFSEFLDEFYQGPSQEALDPEPPAGVDPEFRAFLAATVETLALDWGLKVPKWCFRTNAILTDPICWEIFRGGTHYHPEDRGRIAELISRDTPTVFRQHGIFVRANVLSRV